MIKQWMIKIKQIASHGIHELKSVIACIRTYQNVSYYRFSQFQMILIFIAWLVLFSSFLFVLLFITNIN